MLQSPHLFEFRVIAPSARLGQTLLNHCQLSGLSKYTGDSLALANHDWPGKKPVLTLTLKIPVPNFGAVIEIMNMLSSMNSVEESTLRTCYDGLTVILSLWRLKGERRSLKRRRSGSPAISNPNSGIPMPTQQQLMPLPDESKSCKCTKPHKFRKTDCRGYDEGSAGWFGYE